MGNQNLTQEGKLNVAGTCGQADVLVPLTSKLWGVVGGFYMGGEADVRRGYLNAGTPDASTGSAPTQTWGLRGRLEWDQAVNWGKLSASPYGELSYMRTQSEAYTETGGGFPATFNARREAATDFKLGMNAEYPLTATTKLIGLAEGVHRFEKEGSRVSGTVIGLSGFDLAGQQNTQNWLRFGAGFETHIARGILSVMANTTTRGAAPNAWVNIGWRVEF